MIGWGAGLLIWVMVVSAVMALASFLTFRSWRHFARTARGAAGKALPRTGPDTPLDAAFNPLEAAHPGQNGLLGLFDAHQAFAARAFSAQLAGRSLDLIYYIWRTDMTGWLLVADLLAAADRGVRVRLLLDDVNVQGYDPAFLALNQHPQIEVRLFNPTRNRGHALRRGLEMLLGLARFNRRMHCKAWIADGRLAIVGGRNIGDTYFGAVDQGGRNSIDADLMVVGSAIAEVETHFDRLWNHGLVLPILALWPKFRVSMTRFRRRLARRIAEPRSVAFRAQVLDARDGSTVLSAGLRWTDTVRILSDPVGKAYGRHDAPWMSETVAAVLAEARHEVRLVTPYFVPGSTGMLPLLALAARGVRVSLLTNGLSATDMILVHGAYRRYRWPLLAAGVQINEFAPTADLNRGRDVLHAKIFLIDGRQAIIGSLNLDLRSANTNTEMGVLVEEPEIVAELTRIIDRDSAPERAYALSLQDRALCFAVTRPGLPAQMGFEPEVPALRRAISWAVGKLPIHSYL